MDLNVVVLAGRLATEPEHRSFESGARLLRLLLTVRTEQPRRRVDVVPITLWEPPAGLAGGALVAGQRVWVTGTVQRRFWESAEGRRSRVEIVAHHVQLADAMDDAVGEAT